MFSSLNIRYMLLLDIHSNTFDTVCKQSPKQGGEDEDEAGLHPLAGNLAKDQLRQRDTQPEPQPETNWDGEEAQVQLICNDCGNRSSVYKLPVTSGFASLKICVSSAAVAGETLRCFEENPGTKDSWVLFHLQTEVTTHSTFCRQFLQGEGGSVSLHYNSGECSLVPSFFHDATGKKMEMHKVSFPQSEVNGQQPPAADVLALETMDGCYCCYHGPLFLMVLNDLLKRKLNNKLAKLRRCVIRVSFGSIFFGSINYTLI